jgi:hypothetical protein
MNIRTIPDSLPGEHLLSVVPKPSPTINPPWHRRLNLFTGRSLSDLALQAEQRSRAGHLALLGGSLSPGVVAGLPVTVEVGVDGDRLHVGVGSGITAQGEEIVLSETLQVDIATLLRESSTTTQVQILLLQPATVLTRSLDRADCEDDDRNFAFEDRQLVDGVVLRLYDWAANVSLTGTNAASLSRWRNELAYTLFNQELKLNERGERLPWEAIGLPIALLGLDANLNKVLFADSYAVVRQGGKPLPRSPLVLNSGHEFIWQARVQQFTEQFADIAFQSLDQTAISEYFRYLPPVGLLPANTVDWTTQESLFFPANYGIRARALPLEELDKVIEASASLMPLMLDRPDQVDLIVPVPQAFYEPDVLKSETVDPIFVQTRQRLEQHRAEWLGRRNWNRDRLNLLTKGLTGKSISVDIEDLSEANPPPLNSLEPPEAVYETEISAGILQAKVLEQLRIDLRNQTPLDQDSVVVSGWLATATIPDNLKQKVSLSNENKLLTVKGVLLANERDVLVGLSASNRAAIDDLFTRSQDNNDLEQLNLQSANFTGISNFIQSLESKVSQADDTIEFSFLQVRTDMYRVRQFVLGTEESNRLATSPTLAEIAKRDDSAIATQKDLQKFFEQSRGKPVPRVTVPGARAILGVEPLTASNVEAPAQSIVSPLTTPLVQPLAQPLSQSAFLSNSNLFLGRSSGVSELATSFTGERATLLKGGRATTQLADSVSGSSIKDAILASTSSELFQSTITSADVIAQSPLIGRAQVSLAVGDRLTQPAALQTQAYTIANRQSALESIAKVGIFKDVMIPGKNQSFGQARLGPLLADVDAVSVTNDSDQFTYISSGIKALDSTVAALRLAEGRVQAYRQAISLCQIAVAKLQDTLQQISQRLQVIEGELGEVRHDLSVTQALENEEATRVSAINARRQQVLREHVPFLAFHRPRVADLLVNVPAVYVNPAPTIEPVPACLNGHPAVPDDLRAMVDLLRHAPVGWFVTLPRVVDQLNTLELLHRTFDTVQQRGIIPPIIAAIERKGFGESIERAVQSQRQMLIQYRQVWVNGPILRPPTWQAGRDQANTVLTLGDLIDGNHGRSLVSRQASRLLDQMAQVAACLNDRFNDVPAPIRLDWAQRLSEFDDPINLRSLASLPRWGEIPYLDRRDIQTLADWLYQQMAVTTPAAIAFLNDLVRISILLASHAPVRQIINGNVIKPIPARIGNRLELTVDHTRINIGMTVLLHSVTHEVIAQAIVEDLTQGQATAKITQLLKPEIQQIPINTRARFLHQVF